MRRTPVDRKLNDIMKYIDTVGAPPLPKRSWIELLEEVIEACDSRLESAKHELKDDA
jgi:hypothetical protein